jgi:hypothetical protein
VAWCLRMLWRWAKDSSGGVGAGVECLLVVVIVLANAVDVGGVEDEKVIERGIVGLGISGAGFMLGARACRKEGVDLRGGRGGWGILMLLRMLSGRWYCDVTRATLDRPASLNG